MLTATGALSVLAFYTTGGAELVLKMVGSFREITVGKPLVKGKIHGPDSPLTVV